METSLAGGRITRGVVRVGDTVRRPATAASEFIARLLHHLQQQGADWAPRHHGLDEQGRDILSYLPGTVPRRWGSFDDGQIQAVGRLLRAVHEATRGSALCGDRRVVCHHDFGPNNAVFQGERLVGLIDFDMAAPGDPLEDLGYCAWAWCVSSKVTRPPVGVQAHQVRVLADAYGLGVSDRAQLVDAILERQARNARFWRAALGRPAGVAASAEQMAESIEWSVREAEHVATHRPCFERALA